MNSPLLISLLPPEPFGEAVKAPPDQVSCVVAGLLLAGILLSLWMRPPSQSESGGGITMKKTILLTFVIAVVLLWMGSGIDVPALLTPWAGSETMTFDSQAGFVENPTTGLIREVTAYNVGVRGQTSDEPCIGATGHNLCRLVARGLKICAANFVGPETILHIEGYGECVVLDRMNRRFAHRVDIAMRKDEVDRAIEFGIQRRQVEVKTGASETRRPVVR
jgi:3D (Asp-Asp-Asp) domain-containing protein